VGNFKAAFNWTTARVVITRNADILAGAQVLLRRLPLLGMVWAPKAPVLAEPDAACGSGRSMSCTRC
jgi:hypothetical protein